jgi:parvulin-like peptidyl-prolyl isomerase
VRRFWSLAVVGVLATGALGACGDGGEQPAATVNGVEISQQDVVDELDAIKGNADYLKAYDDSASQNNLPKVSGSSDDTFNTAFVTSTLTTRILYGLVHSEVVKRHIEIDDECRDRAADQAAQRVAGASPTGDGNAVLDAFGSDYKAYLIDREADLLALQADLADQKCVDPDAAENYYNAHKSDFETACVKHILVDSEAEADDLKAQLDAGADFATLAAASSTDTASGAQGGDLGCNPHGTFVQEFEDAVDAAPLNVVTGPIQTQFGWHLILVSSRGVGSFDDVQQQVAQTLAQQVDQAFQTWFQGAVADADVEIDPRYGTWSADQATIEPDDAATTTSTAPAGTGGSGAGGDTGSTDTVPPASDG